MTIRVFPKIYSSITQAGATDGVLFALPLPAGAKVNNVWMEVHIIGAGFQGFETISLYGMHGYVLPVLDPDAGTTPDAIWDAQVPKDAPMAADALDLDTAAADTRAVLELGDVSIAKLVGITTAPHRVFSRETMISLANKPTGYDRTGNNFVPTDIFRARVKSNVSVEVPSYYLIGLSSPDTLASASAWPVINTDGEWAHLQYMEYALQQAWMSLVGLTETGAESPYEDAMNLIANYMEVFHEATAGDFAAITWNALGKATFDVTLPGSADKIQLTAQP